MGGDARAHAAGAAVPRADDGKAGLSGRTYRRHCRCFASLLVRRSVVMASLVAVIATLAGCATRSTPNPRQAELTSRQQAARAMFAERCKRAGEFIHRTVEGVEGIYLPKVRPENPNYEDQFALTDPYGEDLSGRGYLGSFLRGFFVHHSGGGIPIAGGAPQLVGYEYVETKAEDGIEHRYTGRLEEPWQTNKAYLKGYLRFVLDPATRRRGLRRES